MESDKLRYEPVGNDNINFCETIKDSYFPQLIGAEVMYVFDTKGKKSKGKYVCAWIKKMNDEMKFLSMTNDGKVYEYCIFIDKSIWQNLDDDDKKRVIYHEFCHTDVNHDKKNPYGIKDHEIQGFYDEQNVDFYDPRWNERIYLIAESIYS